MVIEQAMILAAGKGKRLQPLTLTTPKPLISVGNQPILSYGLEYLRKAGIKKVVVNTHYLADQIHDYLSTIKDLEVIVVHEKEELLETGGGILNALSYFGGKPFLSVNADIWWEEGGRKPLLQQLLSFWDDSLMDGLLALIPKENAIGVKNRGDYYLESDSRLRYRSSEEDAPYIYGGIQLLHPRLFDGQEIRSFPLPELYHKAQAQGRLFGIVHQGKWCDIGSLDALTQLRGYTQNNSAIFNHSRYI